MAASVRPRGPVPPLEGGVHVAAMQRARVLAAAVAAVRELGYGGASAVQIARRARVSRRTFYELFANREECLVGVLEDCAARVESDIAALELAGRPWRERVRLGLWAILSFLDREPVLARVCVVDCSRGSRLVLERREELLARLVAVLDEGRAENARGAQCPALTPQGLVGAGFSIVQGRLARGDDGALTGLLGELMGMIALPYLGAAAARREQERPLTAAASEPAAPTAGDVAPSGGDPLEELPMRLTYRTARALECIAEQPGISNRLVGERAGIADEGQVSKLLARLEKLGLACNGGRARVKGGANAWSLTAAGRRVASAGLVRVQRGGLPSGSKGRV